MSYVSTRDPIGRPISEAELRARVPSIFAEGKHESRSDRYVYIPTWDVVQAMQREGFVIREAKQGRSRIAGKAEFTKHLIRMRHPGFMDRPRAVGDTYPELVLENAHDGTSRYKLFAGLFKLLCLNGLVVDDGTIGSVAIGHTGKIADRVIDGSFEVLQQAKGTLEHVSEWQGIELKPAERLAFAESVRMLRFGEEEAATSPIRADQFLIPRREPDRGNDLWRTFNVAQENAIRGGLSAMGRDTNGKVRQTSTREIKGIDADLKLNRALFALAAKMAALKQEG
jgi:hypothetical protein